jgi:CBS domain containing-hemolysin-like protein
MIPKNIALAGPDRAALVLGTPIWAIVSVTRPVIAGVNALASAVLRVVGVGLMDEVSSTYTREEVAALVEESRGEGLLEAGEYDRLSGALGFTEKTVETVLMPPDTLQMVRRGSSGADVEALCAATGYSRFPVVDDTGELLGYLHIKDVLETDDVRRNRPIEDKWVRPFAPVGKDDLLHDTLEKLQRRGAHMARVVDAGGATLGVATLEDVIEELVGEIRDTAHLESPVPPPADHREGS